MKIFGLSYQHKSKEIIALVIGVLMFFAPDKIWSQSYGLGFNGQDFSKDLRTGMDLSPKGYLSFNDEFELRFKMLLRPNVIMYFGYIVRIIDNKERNIDLIFNFKSISSSSIEVVCGQNISKIQVKSDVNLLSNEWTEFRLKVDLVNNRVTMQMPDKNYQEEDSGANLAGEVKILFGANEFSHFKTTDVPSMEIKDVCVYEKDKLKYNWPLDETEGNKSKDVIRKKTAEIKNPVWLKPEHNQWQKIHSSSLSGKCEIAFDQDKENIFLIGDEQMTVFSVKKNTAETITYKNKTKNLLGGRQAFYNPGTNSVISYDADLKTVSEFDFNTSSWKEEDPVNKFETIYLHHNQYFSETNNTLYLFGGYGQHEYKNLIQKYDVQKQSWEIIKPSGDTFNPRYLASSANLNDTVYILGGYGSISGEQILNPRNYYDLLAYSLKDNHLKKIYDFNPVFEDMCFSNSMVIDSENKTFYALSFPVIKYNGYLQLVKGSLLKPELKSVSGKIPYLFHDIKSFSTLYHCKSSKKLIAVTSLLNSKNSTEFGLYSISYPPNEITDNLVFQNRNYSLFFYLVLSIAALSFLFLIIKYRKAKGKKSKEINVLKNSKVAISEYKPVQTEKEIVRNSIFFFGGFQVFNHEGIDVTNKFTPLLKELFLLIWLNSIKNDKGISSEKLTEILWFDKDEQSAKNNRAVNIAKLKLIIAEIDTCNLSHKTGYWKFETDETVVFNDYLACTMLCNSKKALTREIINQLILHTSKGEFLQSSNYEWLDEFKDELSNKTIDILNEFALGQKIENDPELIIHLADSVFNFDTVNEEAMILKCRALIHLGKHSIASNTYSKFAKEYKAIYGQFYTKTFNEIIQYKI